MKFKMLLFLLCVSSLNAQGQHIEKGNDFQIYAVSDSRFVGIRVFFKKPFLGIPKCEVYGQRSRITDRDTKSIWILADLGEQVEWECRGAQ